MKYIRIKPFKYPFSIPSPFYHTELEMEIIINRQKALERKKQIALQKIDNDVCIISDSERIKYMQETGRNYLEKYSKHYWKKK